MKAELSREPRIAYKYAAISQAVMMPRIFSVSLPFCVMNTMPIRSAFLIASVNISATLASVILRGTN